MRGALSFDLHASAIKIPISLPSICFNFSGTDRYYMGPVSLKQCEKINLHHGQGALQARTVVPLVVARALRKYPRSVPH